MAEEGMRNFKVTTIDFEGNKSNEIVAAESEVEANEIMSSRGKYVTRITLVTDKRTFGSRKKLKTKILVVFCQQMSTMLKAGINTDQALELVREKAPNEHIKSIYGQIYEDVQKGETIARGIEKTGVFPTLFVNMIKAGETAGDLSGTLQILSIFYKKKAEQDRLVKSAMIYPTILAFVTVAITLLLVVFVLPGITENFSAEQLPTLTKVLMDLSSFIIRRWYILAGIIVAIVILIARLIKIEEVKIFIDKTKMKMPVIGKILTTIYSARAANTISSLYEVGASMLVIVDETGGTIGNKYIETLFDDIYIKVSTGELLSKALQETDVFDPMLTSMIETGEKAGDLQDVLDSVSEDFDRDSAAATDRLIQMLTPAMIIVMGIIVGTIAVAIMLPLMKMGETI